jgi:hypothetical protein
MVYKKGKLLTDFKVRDTDPFRTTLSQKIITTINFYY